MYLPFLDYVDYVGNIQIYIIKTFSRDLILRCKTETQDRNPLSAFEHVSTAEHGGERLFVIVVQVKESSQGTSVAGKLK